MKIVSYRKDNSAVLTGVALDEGVLDISAWIASLPVSSLAQQHNTQAGISAPQGGIMRWLQAGSEAAHALVPYVFAEMSKPHTRLSLLENITLYAPVPRPGKIIGVGRNYADHAKETGVAPFESPRIIFKMPSSVAAPG